MVVVVCTQCGVEFKKNRNKVRENNFCSLSCNGKHKKTSVIINCDECGAEFERCPSEVRKHNFCSSYCRLKQQTTSVTVNCDECGVEFEKNLSNVKEKNFCSLSCNGKHKKNSMTVKCDACGVEVEKRASTVGRRNFCSLSCSWKHKKTSVIVKCDACGVEIEKKASQVTKNNFCSLSCSGKYTSTHKTHGYTRSKLEAWLEKKLTKRHPELEIHYNQRTAIGMELDIYIPSIKIAFEINGPTHYKPIYGEAALKAVKDRDANRKKLSRKNNIKLIEINVSKFNFHERKTEELNNYLNMIEQEIMKSIK
jgi:transcription elongation factor Elf1